MLQRFWLIFTYIQIAEIKIIQNFLELSQTLLKNFFTMRDKKQPCMFMRLLKSPVIKCRDDCLTHTCRGDNQIFIMLVVLTFCFELIKNLLLISIWSDSGFQMKILKRILLFHMQCVI